VKEKDRKIKGLIFVISGPSGSGKTTLVNRLLDGRDLKNKLVKSTSFTTRPHRSAEEPGKDYFFITRDEFNALRSAKKILEWTRYLGYYYGTPKDHIDKQLKKGKNILLCLDFRGALKIKRLYPGNTVTIFVAAPSLTMLQKRIEGRCSRTRKEEIRQRLKLARQEMRNSRKYDYRLVNKSLQKSVGELKNIVLGRLSN